MNNIVLRNWTKCLVKTSGEGGGLLMTKAPSEYSLSRVNAFQNSIPIGNDLAHKYTSISRIAGALASEKLSSSKKYVEKHRHPRFGSR